jgi:hypothetical protein
VHTGALVGAGAEGLGVREVRVSRMPGGVAVVQGGVEVVQQVGGAGEHAAEGLQPVHQLVALALRALVEVCT